MEFFPPPEWMATVHVNDVGTLQAAIFNAHSANLNTKIVLDDDIMLSNPLTVPAGTSILLTGNAANIITLDAGSNGFSVMEVQTDATAVNTMVYFSYIIVRGGNAVSDGGAVYSTGDGDAVIVLENGALFEENTAENGGAIALTKGAVGVFGGKLMDNRASLNGGAIYIQNGHTQPTYGAFRMYMDSSLIAQNEAGMNGGGVFVSDTSDVVITGGTIDNNHADSFGGGLYANSLNISASGCVSNNSANSGGGGIYLNGAGTIRSTAQIIGNSSLHGGGIYMSDNPDTSLDILNNVQIVNNQATGDKGGGGIYLAEHQLAKLTAGISVVFAQNSATQGFPARFPIHDAVYRANIQATQWSANFIQGYNNYDIRYDGSVPPPIPGCHVDGQQMVDVCLPVAVTPFANVGKITSRCCGGAVVTRGADICQGIPNGTCNFTIRQKICVNVPIDFGTIVQPGVPHILCSDEDCDDCPP